MSYETPFLLTSSQLLSKLHWTLQLCWLLLALVWCIYTQKKLSWKCFEAQVLLPLYILNMTKVLVIVPTVKSRRNLAHPNNCSCLMIWDRLWLFVDVWKSVHILCFRGKYYKMHLVSHGVLLTLNPVFIFGHKLSGKWHKQSCYKHTRAHTKRLPSKRCQSG